LQIAEARISIKYIEERYLGVGLSPFAKRRICIEEVCRMRERQRKRVVALKGVMLNPCPADRETPGETKNENWCLERTENFPG